MEREESDWESVVRTLAGRWARLKRGELLPGRGSGSFAEVRGITWGAKVTEDSPEAAMRSLALLLAEGKLPDLLRHGGWTVFDLPEGEASCVVANDTHGNPWAIGVAADGEGGPERDWLCSYMRTEHPIATAVCIHPLATIDTQTLLAAIEDPSAMCDAKPDR